MKRLLAIILLTTACTNKLAQSEDLEIREARLIKLVKTMQKRQDRINAYLRSQRQVSSVKSVQP